MKNRNNIAKQFTDRLGLDFLASMKLRAIWDKKIKPNMPGEFLYEDGMVDFPNFVINLIKDCEQNIAKTDSNVLVKTNTPNPVYRADGVSPSRVTVYLDKNGLPRGYIETVDENGKKLFEHAQHFGFLDNHSFFVESSTASGNNTYVDLRDGEFFYFDKEHEAYRRIVNPAIQQIEEYMEANSTSHAPLYTDEEKLSNM